MPPERTADGHHVVIDGRRWRATDPDIPEDEAARLRRWLMAARRDVGAALKADDADADVAVVNNSGGAHLADAVGTPVVELFAGTEEVGQYAPRTVPAEVLTRPVTCSPCRQLVCPFDQECLDIAPERVVDAVVRVAAPREQKVGS